MQPTCDAILEAALALPEGERFALVAQLLESMPAEDAALSCDDPGLIDELDRRFADREGSIPWSELQSEK